MRNDTGLIIFGLVLLVILLCFVIFIIWGEIKFNNRYSRNFVKKKDLDDKFIEFLNNTNLDLDTSLRKLMLGALSQYEFKDLDSHCHMIWNRFRTLYEEDRNMFIDEIVLAINKRQLVGDRLLADYMKSTIEKGGD